jgi:hypothetical protein
MGLSVLILLGLAGAVQAEKKSLKAAWLVLSRQKKNP